MEEQNCTQFPGSDLAAGPTEISISESLIGRFHFQLSCPIVLSGNAKVFSSIGLHFDRCRVVTKPLGSRSPRRAALLMRDEWSCHCVCNVETWSLSLAPWKCDAAFLKCDMTSSTSGTGVRVDY